MARIPPSGYGPRAPATSRPTWVMEAYKYRNGKRARTAGTSPRCHFKSQRLHYKPSLPAATPFVSRLLISTRIPSSRHVAAPMAPRGPGRPFPTCVAAHTTTRVSLICSSRCPSLQRGKTGSWLTRGGASNEKGAADEDLLNCRESTERERADRARKTTGPKQTCRKQTQKGSARASGHRGQNQSSRRHPQATGPHQPNQGGDRPDKTRIFFRCSCLLRDDEPYASQEEPSHLILLMGL